MRQAQVAGPAAGARFGGMLGALTWGALTLGLYSISSARPALLLAWFIGETAQMAAAGAIAGAALAGRPLGKLALVVVGLIVACIAATVILQATGLAPPMSLAE